MKVRKETAGKEEKGEEQQRPSDLEDFLFEHYCREIFGATYIASTKQVTEKPTIESPQR